MKLGKHDIKCRVCDRIEYIIHKDSEDFVCHFCCDLNITDKNDLQEFLEHQSEEFKKL